MNLSEKIGIDLESRFKAINEFNESLNKQGFEPPREPISKRLENIISSIKDTNKTPTDIIRLFYGEFGGNEFLKDYDIKTEMDEAFKNLSIYEMTKLPLTENAGVLIAFILYDFGEYTRNFQYIKAKKELQKPIGKKIKEIDDLILSLRDKKIKNIFRSFYYSGLDIQIDMAIAELEKLKNEFGVYNQYFKKSVDKTIKNRNRIYYKELLLKIATELNLPLTPFKRNTLLNLLEKQLKERYTIEYFMKI